MNLEEFKEEQPIVYQIILNSIENNKISHAYLFDISDYDRGFNFIMAFIKLIIAKNSNIEINSQQMLDLSKVIDNGNYPDLEIINPDGQWIKKEQLDRLQSKFSTKSIYGNKKIYIINGAEYLNTSSSNSILKFLEEPEPNIIAILITKNPNNILDTIKSRCINFTFSSTKKNGDLLDKILSFLYNDEESKNKFIEQNNTLEIIEQVLYFIKYYESNKLRSLIHIYNLWFNKINDKNKNIFALYTMLLFYKDVINQKMNKNLDFFNEYTEFIEKISNINSIKSISQKINIIIETIEKNKVNVNLNLNIDNMIMEMENIYD